MASSNKDRALQWYYDNVVGNEEKISERREYARKYKIEHADDFDASQKRYRDRIKDELLAYRALKEKEIFEWLDNHPKFRERVMADYKANELRKQRTWNNTRRDADVISAREKEKAYYEANSYNKILTQVEYQERNKAEISAYNKIRYAFFKDGDCRPTKCTKCSSEKGKMVMANTGDGWIADPDKYTWLCSTCFGLHKRIDKDGV